VHKGQITCRVRAPTNMRVLNRLVQDGGSLWFCHCLEQIDRLAGANERSNWDDLLAITPFDEIEQSVMW